MNSNSIHDMIGDKLVQLVTAACITNVSDPDYQASEVRQGLLQQDPVENRITLLVNPGDPEDSRSEPKWSDVPAGEDPSMGYPSFEMGGGGFMLRRFSIDVRAYFINSQEDRETARKIATFIFKSAEKAVHQATMGFTDSFGEFALQSFVKKTIPFESGGPPNQFIWRGKILVQVLTELP